MVDSVRENSSLDSSVPLVVLKTLDEIRAWRRKAENVGFVPTMGSLHEGHLELVKLAKTKCSCVIVSIFVNPSQFAPDEDLSKYPRDTEADLAKLKGLADAVFLPPVELIYPSGITLDTSKQLGAFVEVVGKSHQMEGAIRPHFFRGVATVVTKLLNIVQPDFLILGQKDAQQCVVLKTLVSDLCFNVKVIVGPTQRDSKGLALSSRNIYLDKKVRESKALALYHGLTEAEKLFSTGARDRLSILEAVSNSLNSFTGVTLEYLSLVHPWTLKEEEVISSDGAILSGAIKVGDPAVRLIDNVLLGCTL